MEEIESVGVYENPHPHPTPTIPSLSIPSQTNTSQRNSTGCYSLNKWEIVIYIVSLIGVSIAVGKIVVISLFIPDLYKEYPERSTTYFCGIGIALSAIVVVWEVPMLYFLRVRKLSGLQQWMFAMMMHWLGSCIAAVVTGAVYKMPGIFLSMSFVADMIRIPPQMRFVHMFIKSEKLNEDATFFAAYYKKF